MANIDDSALGRFRTSMSSPSGAHDYDVLAHILNGDPASSESNCSLSLLLTPDTSTTSSVDLATDAADITELRALPNTPTIATKDTERDDGGSRSSDMVFSNRCNKSTNDLHLATPIIEPRFIKDAKEGPAPFTKPHIITDTFKTPFTGPHTAIEIPFGPDRGKFLHLPRNLSATEINLAALAIFWLWSGYRKYKGPQTPAETTTMDMAPTIPRKMILAQMVGPPSAPYPMTVSTFPPFLGPRTYIRNYGHHLRGWLLHVPRFLTKEQIRIASKNLRRTADGPDSWGHRHDPYFMFEIKREPLEDLMLTDLLHQQELAATFLHEMVGLDFSVQDQESDGPTPIWVEASDIWTPVTPCRRIRVLASPSTNSECSPPETSKVHHIPTEPAHCSRKTVGSTCTSWEDSTRPSNSIKEIIMLNIAESEPTAGNGAALCSPNPVETKIEPDQLEAVVGLPSMTLYAGVIERNNELAVTNMVDDSASVTDEDSFLDQSIVRDSPLFLRSIEAQVRYFERRAEQLREEHSIPNNTRPSLLKSEAGRAIKPFAIDEQVQQRKPMTRETVLSHIIRSHIVLGLPASIVSFITFSCFKGMQAYITDPSHVAAFLDVDHERRKAIALLIVVGMVLSFPALLVLCADRRRLKGFVTVVVIGAWTSFGAIQALEPKLLERTY
jgi:hypothetical protein